MKNLRISYFYIILQTWISINCKESDGSEDHPLLSDSFNDATGHDQFVDPFAFDYDRVDKTMDSTPSAESIRSQDTSRGHDQFVDPFSFDYDRVDKKMGSVPPAESLRSRGTSFGDSECKFELKECRDALTNFQHEESFARRLINMLLSNAKLKESDDRLEGTIILSGTKEQIENLKRYGNGKITMRQIDAILTDVITPSIDIFGEALSFFEHLSMVIYQHWAICAALSAACAVLLSIKFINWSSGKVIIVFLSLIFLTSFFMIWSQLIKEAKIKRFVEVGKQKGPPVQCDPENMSSWETFVTYFHRDDKCFEFYKAIDLDPIQMVTPLDALIELLDRFLIKPAGRFGSGISHFIDNSTQHLAFPMKWVVTILLYIGIAGVMIVLPFSISGSGFGLSFGPFFRISLGKGQTDAKNRQERLQQGQQQPTTAIAERREPITHILQVHFNGELQPQLSTNAVVQSTDNNQLIKAGGDSESNANREIDRESSSGSCKMCCCKETLPSSNLHVEQVLDLKNEPAAITRQQRDEKGDGDC